METLFNVAESMLETAMIATLRCDELDHACYVSILICFFIISIALLRWGVQLTIKLLKKRWNY